MVNFNFDEFKDKLIKQLDFPSVYMFKFIIESDNKKLALVEALFREESEISTRTSSNGKFISVTSKQVVLNVEEVITIYKNAQNIEGIMAL
jgi:putative lipoic acid-binding regulatory protein